MQSRQRAPVGEDRIDAAGAPPGCRRTARVRATNTRCGGPTEASTEKCALCPGIVTTPCALKLPRRCCASRVRPSRSRPQTSAPSGTAFAIRGDREITDLVRRHPCGGRRSSQTTPLVVRRDATANRDCFSSSLHAGTPRCRSRPAERSVRGQRLNRHRALRDVKEEAGERPGARIECTLGHQPLSLRQRKRQHIRRSGACDVRRHDDRRSGRVAAADTQSSRRAVATSCNAAGAVPRALAASSTGATAAATPSSSDGSPRSAGQCGAASAVAAVGCQFARKRACVRARIARADQFRFAAASAREQQQGERDGRGWTSGTKPESRWGPFPRHGAANTQVACRHEAQSALLDQGRARTPGRIEEAV